MDPTDLLTPEWILRRLHWQVLRRLDGRLQGDYRTLLRGDGTDFLDLRAYEWGDDVRHIDWNATARMDELLVRDFMEDRELTAWLLIDRSRSMTFGPAGRTKEARARASSPPSSGSCSSRNGNRVGAIIFDGEHHTILPPRQGRNHILGLLHALLRPVEAATSTDLAKLFSTAEQLLRRRSLVVVISDFVSEPDWERPLLRLTRRHEVIAVRMVDPREHELPDAGLLYVQDAETGEVLLVDSSDPEFRRRLHALADEHDETIRRSRGAGPRRPPRRVDRGRPAARVRADGGPSAGGA